jgi:hypothetical protein
MIGVQSLGFNVAVAEHYIAACDNPRRQRGVLVTASLRLFR